MKSHKKMHKHTIVLVNSIKGRMWMYKLFLGERSKRYFVQPLLVLSLLLFIASVVFVIIFSLQRNKIIDEKIPNKPIGVPSTPLPSLPNTPSPTPEGGATAPPAGDNTDTTRRENTITMETLAYILSILSFFFFIVIFALLRYIRSMAGKDNSEAREALEKELSIAKNINTQLTSDLKAAGDDLKVVELKMIESIDKLSENEKKMKEMTNRDEASEKENVKKIEEMLEKIQIIKSAFEKMDEENKLLKKEKEKLENVVKTKAQDIETMESDHKLFSDSQETTINMLKNTVQNLENTVKKNGSNSLHEEEIKMLEIKVQNLSAALENIMEFSRKDNVKANNPLLENLLKSVLIRYPLLFTKKEKGVDTKNEKEVDTLSASFKNMEI
jgi:hypothetical protein